MGISKISIKNDKKRLKKIKIKYFYFFIWDNYFF